MQGVGYRALLRHSARKLGVNGWVRNRMDGTVEAVLQGSQEAVDALIAWARRGPPGSQVADVADVAVEDKADFSGFELRPTC